MIFSSIKWREVDEASETRSLTAGAHGGDPCPLKQFPAESLQEKERSRNDLGTLDDLHSHQDEKHFIFHSQTAFASLYRVR